MSVLTRVQANPEIGSTNATWVTDLCERAKRFVVGYCNLRRFPELSQGYSKSAAAPATDLTAISGAGLLVSVNGSPFYSFSLTLANCTTGDATAAELQTQLRTRGWDHGFEEVTVVYNDDSAGAEYYLITSGRYGERSAVEVSFYAHDPYVAKAMKLSQAFGGTELCGADFREDAEDAAVEIAEAKYRTLGVEGAASVSASGDYSITFADVPGATLKRLKSIRRIC